MQDIHTRCVEEGSHGKSNRVDYIDGANIAGFKKIATALLAYGAI